MAEIVDIKGVGPVMGDALKSCGFDSVAQIAGAAPSELAVVPGLGEQRAKSVIDAARSLLAKAPPEQVNSEAAGVAESPDEPIVDTLATGSGKGKKKKASKDEKKNKSKKGKKKKDKKKKKKNKKKKKKK